MLSLRFVVDSTHASALAELGASIGEPWALLQESLVGAQGGGVLPLSDVKLDHWASKVVDVSKTNWLLDILVLLNCEWERIAVLNGSRRDDFNVSIGSWSSHLDVDGLLDDDGWAVDFGIGHVSLVY